MQKIKPGSVDIVFYCEACRRILALTLADKTSLNGQSAPETFLLERGTIARMMCPGCRYIDLPAPAYPTFFPLRHSALHAPLARILDTVSPPDADFVAEPNTILLAWFDIRDIMNSGDRLRAVEMGPGRQLMFKPLFTEFGMI